MGARLGSVLLSPWTWAVVAFGARLAWIFAGDGLAATPWSDSVDYHRLAAHLAAGKGFTLGPADALYPTTFRPPLVPFLVAPLYALVGPHYGAALVLQAAVGALVAPTGGALARALVRAAGRDEGFARSAAALAAAALALWPPLVYFAGALLTETTAAVLVTAALVLAVRLHGAGGTGRALTTGAVLGLAALARPTALPLAAALAAWLALAPPRAPAVRLREAALVLLATALVLAPWTLRNRAVTGSWIAVTSGGGAALWDGNNPLVASDPAWRGGALSLRETEPYAREFAGMDELAIDRHAAARGRAFLAEDPVRALRMAGWKLARMYRVTRDTPVSGDAAAPGSAGARLAGAVDPLALSWGVLLPFCAVAFAYALVRPRRAEFAAVLAIVVQSALAAVYWGSLRFRAPIEPALVVLAVLALVATWTALSGPGRRSRP